MTEKDYSKNPYRRFRLTRDVVVPAGTELSAAPLERGGYDRIEAIVGLGNDATCYLNVPLRVAEVDAAEWFEEVKKEENEGGEGGYTGPSSAEGRLGEVTG